MCNTTKPGNECPAARPAHPAIRSRAQRRCRGSSPAARCAASRPARIATAALIGCTVNGRDIVQGMMTGGFAVKRSVQ